MRNDGHFLYHATFTISMNIIFTAPKEQATPIFLRNGLNVVHRRTVLAGTLLRFAQTCHQI